MAAMADPDGEPLPMPAPPEVIARDEIGHVTVRATRVTERLIIDGHLDDAAYQAVRSMSGFVQQEPREGQVATEQTDVWILFDDGQLYIAARCWQDPRLRMVANDMRRDGQNIFRNDNFAVILDTFHDKRNGFLFQTNPIGAIADQQMTDEGASFNRDWNTVWDVRTARFDRGWTVEMAIPLKSLRFPAGQQQIWGINFRRIVQSKSEYSYLAPIPASGGFRGLARVSLAATMVGLEVGGGTGQFEIKPYVLGTLNTDNEAEPPYRNDVDPKAGMDVKVGVSRGLVADLTYNTDFAQVEEDEVQVNLTRFDLYFPEKRDFFLEGQGIFSFGGAGGHGPGGGPPSDTPVLFYSRRVGVGNELPVDLQGGARVTGKVGPWSLGLLQIRQEASQREDLPTTDFTVVRARRDVLRRSTVGLIGTYRSASISGAGDNLVAGADAYLAFFQNLFVNAYWATSRTDGRDGDDTSYRAQLDYTADRYGLELEYMSVGEDFNPEVGFLRREDFKRSFVQARFSPRPKASKRVLKYSYEGGFEYVTGSDYALESQQAQLTWSVEFLNGDSFDVDFENIAEVLDEPFEVTEDVDIPVGSYRFNNLRVSYELGSQHRATGRITVVRGGFYGGDRTEVRYRGRIELSPRLSLEPNVSLNWLEIPQEKFRTDLLGTRVTATLSPRLAASVLVQWTAQDNMFSGSARLRWEYRPGSDLFVVYSEGRDTDGPTRFFLQTRTFAVKVTRLVRF